MRFNTSSSLQIRARGIVPSRTAECSRICGPGVSLGVAAAPLKSRRTSGCRSQRSLLRLCVALFASAAFGFGQSASEAEQGGPGQSRDLPGASQPAATSTAPVPNDLAAAIERAGDPSAAVEAYAKARAAAPGDPQLAVAYVHRMVALRAPQLAQKQAKEVVQQNPEDGIAWAVLAFCDGAMNNTNAAMNELTSATRLAPEDEFVQYTAGQLLGWYDALGKASDLPPGLPEKLQFIKEDFGERPAFAETYKGALSFYKQQQPGAQQQQTTEQQTAGPGVTDSSTAARSQPSGALRSTDAAPERSTPSMASRGMSPLETDLPVPLLVRVAEKVPFELPNGQILILFDHKVGHDKIRYEVDGIEYKPHVGATVAFPGPDYMVLVTCTRWKLLKKYYGRDSAEFKIECVSKPALQTPVNLAPHSPTFVAPPPSFEDEMSPPGPEAVAPPLPPACAARPSRPALAQPQYRTQAPVELRALPAPQCVILAEKRPFCLPNGQFLILMDHKVGDDQVRYEVDGIEYKPAVGETLVFSGRSFSVHVTCSRWKLLKKYYGRDSAEFLIESFPTP
jgi:tetratricopeptide (TPR) repeat protein